MTGKTIADAREIVYRDPRPLKPYDRNARTHPPEQIAAICASIRKRGFTAPVLLREDEVSIGVGHGRVEAAVAMLEAGERLPTPDGETIPTIVLYGLTDADWRAYIIDDNRLGELSGWDHGLLRLEFGELQTVGYDLGLTGFDAAALGELQVPGFVAPPAPPPEPKIKLADRFGIPPFSVLNAREGWWQDRKRAWLRLGIKSEVGRGEAGGRTFGQDMLLNEGGLAPERGVTRRGNIDGGVLMQTPTAADPNFYRKKTKAEEGVTSGRGVMGHPETTADPAFYAKKRETEARLGRKIPLKEFLAKHYVPDESAVASGTSIFDPVLCELLYRWFAPPGGVVLDPFAGGSVRGVVAGKLGRRYIGTELRAEQVEANREQADAIFGAAPAGKEIVPEWIVTDAARIETVVEGEADFVFSCPPYADLEVYSDDPRDLSTMPYGDFIDAYRVIIAAACAKLRPDRFAAFVVGDVRDEKGFYRGFVRDTELAFEAAGLRLYNEAILVTSAGSLPIRAGRQFETTRKMGKTHQNVLVFVKGDPKKATREVGKVEFGAIDATAGHEQAPPE